MCVWLNELDCVRVGVSVGQKEGGNHHERFKSEYVVVHSSNQGTYKRDCNSITEPQLNKSFHSGKICDTV